MVTSSMTAKTGQDIKGSMVWTYCLDVEGGAGVDLERTAFVACSRRHMATGGWRWIAARAEHLVQGFYIDFGAGGELRKAHRGVDVVAQSSLRGDFLRRGGFRWLRWSRLFGKRESRLARAWTVCLKARVRGIFGFFFQWRWNIYITICVAAMDRLLFRDLIDLREVLCKTVPPLRDPSYLRPLRSG